MRKQRPREFGLLAREDARAAMESVVQQANASVFDEREART